MQKAQDDITTLQQQNARLRRNLREIRWLLLLSLIPIAGIIVSLIMLWPK
jgi:hypothetical protein